MNVEWIVDEYVTKKRTSIDIAKELGIHPTTVTRYLKLSGVATRPTTGENNGKQRKLLSTISDDAKKKFTNRDWLIEQYNSGIGSEKLGKILGIPGHVIVAQLKRFGADVKTTHEKMSTNIGESNLGKLNDRDWMVHQYSILGKSSVEIGNALGVNHLTILSKLRGLDITVRTNEGIDSSSRREMHKRLTIEQSRKIEDIEWIKHQYIDLNRSYDDIAAECGVWPYTARARLLAAGVTIRSDHYVSGPEQEIADWLRSLLGYHQVEQSVRGLLSKNREIDIWLPTIGIGIEYNGIPWHLEGFAGKGKDYHLSKTEEMICRGHRLIHVWSFDWIRNKEEIKEKILQTITNSHPVSDDEVVYVDRMWGDGGWLLDHEYSLVSTSEPRAWYYDKLLKAPIASTHPDIKGKTWDTLKDLGYDRFWDCGLKVYEKTIRR